jgi:hypothetical protein
VAVEVCYRGSAEQPPEAETFHDDSKAKRKRKKKGNKIGKLEETQAGTGTATKESGIATDTGRASGDDKKSTKKKKSRDPNKKQRKLRILLWRVCWPLD